MPLTSGQFLSFYEILGPLGAGGMGEVYRARDSRLDREVAIKVLSEELADDEERLQRFEREAKVLASLNHPNIAGIHGVDQDGGVSFLALELVPGDDLSARLERGALPVDVALDVCRQIAEGLEAAHAAGIVHRDLKPANVRVTPDGNVKLLDFGLARPTPDGLHSGAGLATTEAGRILGTPMYMSPEQSRGRPLDARSDVWAFGCILFECLTGRCPFEGETLADLLVAVSEREPDWSALPGATPSAVRRLLERCLEKDVRSRLQAVGEARIVLEDPGRPGSGSRAVPERSRSVRIGLWLGVAVLAILAYALGTRAAEEPLVPPTIRLGIELPAGQVLDLPNPLSGGLDGVAPPVAITPDGSLLAYLARDGEGPTGLFLRPLDSFETRLLDGTEYAEAPFFSPDGHWLGFFQAGGLYKLAVRGDSAAIQIAAIPLVDRGSAAWGRDGTIVFSSGINAEGRLERVPASGGELEELTVPNSAAGESWHGLPQFLPGGKTILFTVALRDEGARAALLDLESGEWHIIEGTGEAAGARYFRADEGEPGVLLFAHAGRLLAAAFDLDSGTLSGTPWSVIDQVSSSALDVGHWACSESGALAYVSGNVAESELVLVDRTGEITWKSPETGAYQHPRISPDGERLLFDWIKSGGRDIWTYDIARQVPRRLTAESRNMDPLWAPDGERVVFSRFVDSVRTLHLLDTGKVGGQPTRLLTGSENQISGTWSPTGQLLFTISGPAKEDLWLLPSLDDREAQPVLQGPGRQGFGSISPDGRFLAYVSDGSDGGLEVYACSYPDLADPQRITYGGGSEPLWSGDGAELFYRKGLDFLAAPVTVTEAGLNVGQAARLFRGAYDYSPTGHQHYDVTRDGQRFALVKRLQGEAQSELRVILNWRPAESSARPSVR